MYKLTFNSFCQVLLFVNCQIGPLNSLLIRFPVGKKKKIPHFLVFCLRDLSWIYTLPNDVSSLYIQKKWDGRTEFCISEPKDTKFTKEMSECPTGLALKDWESWRLAFCSSGTFLSSLHLRSPCFSFILIKTCNVLDANCEEEFVPQSGIWQDHRTVSLTPTTTRPNVSTELSFPCFTLPNSGNPQPVPLQVQE